MINDLERFLQTMAYGSVDRPPLWDEGIREDVWDTWQQQTGIGPETFYERHPCDRHGMVEVNIRPIPEFRPGDADSFLQLRNHYQANTVRLPDDWQEQVRLRAQHDEPVGMTVSRGVFQCLGVGAWDSLERLLFAMADAPDVIEEAMQHATNLSLWALDRVLDEVTLDFAILSEPVASFHAPVISPAYYRRFAMPHVTRLIDRLQMADVKVIMIQLYGNVTPLIPLWLEAGVNTLRCAHANQRDMDYLALRRQYGKSLRLIGGIDTISLQMGKAAIDAELRRVVLPLSEEGGYLPMLDDRVRPDVPYANFCYYREQLENMIMG